MYKFVRAAVFSKMEGKEALRNRLTPIQYQVTQEHGTEPPYRNPYWDLKDPGIYNCIVCGTALFSSQNKFESSCGWPAFTKGLVDIPETRDTTHGMVRVEVRCGSCSAHLGHVFNDGPPPTHMRYCINSASLDFVPKSVEKSKL